jgi:hypothetical protein
MAAAAREVPVVPLRLVALGRRMPPEPVRQYIWYSIQYTTIPVTET